MDTQASLEFGVSDALAAASLRVLVAKTEQWALLGTVIGGSSEGISKETRTRFAIPLFPK